MKKLFYLVVFFLPIAVQAQNKCDFSLGADFVSSYVWRGSILAGTSIQPAMGLNIGGFHVGAWGSVDIASVGYKEVDLLASYSLGNFVIGLSDYWSDGEGAYSYFNLTDSTGHALEANLAYTFGSFPLTLMWNTMIAGNDKYIDDNGDSKRAFSTYIEAAYAFSIKEIDLEAAIGASPWKSNTMYTYYERNGQAYGTDGFAVVNISLKASKDIRITDNYSLAVFGQLAFNPATEDAFFVFGVSF